ncbi:substrate-binding domain-containing protein [Acetivibrio mesophilus]|uniref:histidine kinase n=1 Tax=Acetivibrio mesophilus TaxID=2487273 RepID=A0A4V1K296_9FIRM|nr:substrate-binding domain-containing protein [Acetivibrio mesophilus]ODM25896.1 histidine kinase [Clostridium sp. Bc-iso-3]RXE59519.1 histidine kinase [Acetivibrio mesophilus]HHV29995.1 substrate-binding domain-containing protein [Clostridium sp.]
MKKRRTIGFLINDIDVSYSNLVYLMTKKAAEKYDCNLIIYEGRSFNNSSRADSQHQISYGFVDSSRLDGILMTSAPIASYISDEEFIGFCKRYEGIPLVSLGIVVPHTTSIIIDNKQGMKSLIAHLIKDHGFRKVIYISGPPTNMDSIERMEAYYEVLAENNIDVDTSLIFNGDFLAQSGYDVMKEIIKNGIEYDAVVCANDEMALGAVKCIRDLKDAYNLDLTKKSIICGFDDTVTSRLVKPSLTTVRQPIEEMCFCAVENLLKKIEGEKVDDVIRLSSVLVKRESCGCKGSSEASSVSDSSLRLVPGQRIHEYIQTYSLEELFDCVTRALKLCYIRSCLIFKYCGGTLLYDNDSVFRDNFTLPENSEMIYAYYDDKRVAIEDSSRYIKTKNIVPDQFFREDRRYTYLVNPLFFNNEHFGFVCFEVVNDDVLNFEPIRGQISNTLNSALMLMERSKIEESFRETERLASLGQLIGGISHNLMTPIMSISGACFGLEDLINEYRTSIEDPSVTVQDHKDIAKDMQDWIDKLKEYNSYMSNVIATVKSQAVQLNSDTINEFTIEELINRIEFIKNNNQKMRRAIINYKVDIDCKTTIAGDISNLVQIIENLFINAVQSYESMQNDNIVIDFHILEDGNMVKYVIRDYGKGIPEDIQDKLFRRMVTTKGKDGTGLSLLLSYSTIKGRFGGELWVESKENAGTTFYITIPIANKS